EIGGPCREIPPQGLGDSCSAKVGTRAAGETSAVGNYINRSVIFSDRRNRQNIILGIGRRELIDNIGAATGLARPQTRYIRIQIIRSAKGRRRGAERQAARLNESG